MTGVGAEVAFVSFATEAKKKSKASGKLVSFKLLRTTAVC